MRLTKRQLKRIIREEYSRLKRRGLIREAGEVEHEEDEFLADQLDQYASQLKRAAQECAMAGYREQETNPDSESPESMAANACMFYGQDNQGPEAVLNVLMKCNKFSLIFHHMREEQKEAFGYSAPKHMVLDMMVDLGIADECIRAAQAEMTGNDPINLGL